MSDRILFIDSSGPGLAPGVGGSPGTRSKRPGSSGASRPRSSGGNRRGAKAGPSDFRQRFDRNELPVAVETRGLGRKLVWREPLDAASAGAGSGGGSGAGVDIPHLLPVFCDGLREREDPYSYVALEGTLDLILAAGPKIVPMLDAIVRPLKTALNSRDPDILLTVTKVLQQLTVADPEVGPALVAHYRHLLPMFNIHLAKHGACTSAMCLGAGVVR